MSSPLGPGPRTTTGRGLAAVREVLDDLRRPGTTRPVQRVERSDVRAAVLTVLTEGPASGYDIVRTLEQRGAGGRTPGAGAVYPTLQLLVDEGLASVAESDGGRTYSLTDAGRSAAASARVAVPVDAPGRVGPVRRGALARSTAQLVQAATAVPQTGTPAQIAEAVAVLDEARRRLYAILARN